MTITLCALNDLIPGRGAAVLLRDGHQLALFRHSDNSVDALDNHDPATGANVLSRGLLGDKDGNRVVVSPLLKHSYRLDDGTCLEGPWTVAVHSVTVVQGTVCLNTEPLEARKAQEPTCQTVSLH
ncbi:nitrite reductase small subunit NirD [Haloglycomyces albus]|uniref:nitrite reductase small subunit NirD n=1 Tax=Haloglycomyces albus TaxID=526067 RepID=UPI00046CCFF4|nr:nitrite reductase small subunit NirD [Haloglycomyces albus]